MSHLIRQEDFIAAAQLAFRMNKLRDFYHILTRVMKAEDKGLDQVDCYVEDQKKFLAIEGNGFNEAQSMSTNKKLLKKIMGKLLKEDKIKVMEILKNLNTKYEYAQLAQYLMGSVLDKVDVEEFLETYKKDEKKSTQDLKDNLSATLTYTYKHQDRFER